MRNLGVLALAAVVLVAAGCSSNNPNSIMGPAAMSTSLSGSMTPTPPTVTPIAGFFGTISNLNLGAGTFTLTSPSGTTLDVTVASNAIVLYEGSTTDVGTSVMRDGLQVTITGTAVGLPDQAKVRVQLIIVNSSASNETALSAS